MIFLGPAGGSAPLMRGANPFLMMWIWLVEMENAFSSRRVILYSTMLGQIVAKSECESFRHGVASRVRFLRNYRDPTVRLEWWRKNKLFQIKARPMVHTGGPGTIVYWLIFCFEVSPLID